MAGYIGSKSSVISSGAAFKNTFAISTTTTSLTGVTYTVNRVNVFHNGVRLVDGTDYTATNGTSITLTSAAENGDQIVVTSQASFNIANTYTQAEANSTFLTPTGNGSQLTNLPASGAASLNELTDCTVSTADPTVSTNPTSGLGHMWINKTSGEVYILTTATSGANIWTNTGDGTGPVEPVVFITATGGTVTTDGDYKVHTFTSSGTLNVTNTTGTLASATYLISAGGGSGGLTTLSDYMQGGGGGAGGCLYGSLAPALNTAYTIVIGAGGAVGTYPNPNNGSNSTGLGLSAIGGGKGSNYSYAAGAGGSGGGGSAAGEDSSTIGAYGSGTVGQGNRGGTGNWTAYAQTGGGGGGGATAVGSNSAGSGAAGAGGTGYTSSISGSSVTYSTGGPGGGSVTQALPSPTGPANSGQGGGGSQGNRQINYPGGSGVFIFRYQFQ